MEISTIWIFLNDNTTQDILLQFLNISLLEQ